MKVDQHLAKKMVSQQFPHLAHLDLSAVESSGTDNFIFRLGSQLAVRMPSVEWAADYIKKEFDWMPKLSPFLPLKIPVPIALGVPSDSYPWHWSVFQWIGGRDLTKASIEDANQEAISMAAFISALQNQIPSDAAPLSPRGLPVRMNDSEVRDAIRSLEGSIDTNKATAIWEKVLEAPDWDGPSVYVHGDLHAGNLLAEDGKLVAVIDFGCFGVGDPACDLLPAWSLFSGESRELFRSALNPDDATWIRGQGWALYMGLTALPYYEKTNPIFANIARRLIREVFSEYPNE